MLPFYPNWNIFNNRRLVKKEAQLRECRSAKREVAGSNPSRTNTQGLKITEEKVLPSQWLRFGGEGMVVSVALRMWKDLTQIWLTSQVVCFFWLVWFPIPDFFLPYKSLYSNAKQQSRRSYFELGLNVLFAATTLLTPLYFVQPSCFVATCGSLTYICSAKLMSEKCWVMVHMQCTCFVWLASQLTSCARGIFDCRWVFVSRDAVDIAINNC